MLVAVTDRTKVECGMCWTTAALAVEESSREFKRVSWVCDSLLLSFFLICSNVGYEQQELVQASSTSSVGGVGVLPLPYEFLAADDGKFNEMPA